MTRDQRDSLPLRIETERLTLRAPMRGDVPALVANADNRRIAEMLAVLPHPYTRADAIGFVEILCQRPDLRAYAVTLKDRTFLGIVSLSYYPGKPPEIGYWLGEPHWGRGYATEAGRGLFAAAAATGFYSEIRATAKARNAASRAVLGKLGMVETGEYIGSCGTDAGIPIVGFSIVLQP